MVNLGFTIFLGVALLQGVLTLSPIPVPEEEWAEFSRMLRDPSYRLPTTTRPRHYAVTLTPYFDVVPAGVSSLTTFSFDGEVTIYISPTQANVNEIVLHCNDLTIQSLRVTYVSGNSEVDITATGQTFTCEMPYSFLRIRTSTPLVMNQEYIIRSTFRGNLQTNMRGFYRSWYVDRTGKRWMATTQLQPGHARQAFPCYDEPGFKATFDITMNREADFSPTISNMPIRATTTLTNGRISETFFTTPLTSTYLLAFIVSHYQVISNNNNAARPFRIYARNNVGSQGDWSLEMGEKLLLAMENYTAIPYYTMAQNIDMKQAAIPDFSAGAMENWGLLTYREALILYDPLNSNHHYRQRVANIVSHEIAHMWFGNLVTCAWWDNLWLNEGFARFYQYYLTATVDPELGYEIRFIPEQLQVAMFSDSVDSAHALTDTSVNDPVAVSAHFSTITYARGAAILRMTQHLLSYDTFVKGLRQYLRARQFDVAEPYHLFSALDAAAAEDNALAAYTGITIDAYFRTWSEKAGHPLLSVTVDHETGRMTLVQARWERNTGVSRFPGLWHIPITWTRAGAPDFENLKPSQVMTGQSLVIDRGTRGQEWVIFNKQVSGFYRVNYDNTTWGLITRALRSANRTVIHELSRSQIVDDVFQLARSGVMSYQRALNILSYLRFEDAYAPWLSAISGFNWVIRRFAHDAANLQTLQNQIIGLSEAVVARLGFTEVSGGTYMTDLQRLHVMQFLCNVGHQQCIDTGRQNFLNWRNGSFIPANMRPWVYCTGLRYGSAEDFNYFWNRYIVEDLSNEKVVMLEAAGCTRDQASLEKFLNAIVSGNDDVRPQDHSSALSSAITSNDVNTMRAFDWLTKNVDQITRTLGSITSPLNTITSRLLTEAQMTQVQTWLDANRNTIGAAYNTGVNGIATSRANLQWSANRMSEFLRFFETGFVDDVPSEATTVAPPAETTVTPSTFPPTEAPATTPAPGSGNIAALSVVSLLVTLAINMVA
uniref:Aminopeptidase n=1 Tax=Manduca sexta TaxID=7130 RepID=Q9U7N8_MANSE|nr:aminopeptidase N [Manduca sexta]